jgi:hypothetical protein
MRKTSSNKRSSNDPNNGISLNNSGEKRLTNFEK